MESDRLDLEDIPLKKTYSIVQKKKGLRFNERIWDQNRNEVYLSFVTDQYFEIYLMSFELLDVENANESRYKIPAIVFTFFIFFFWKIVQNKMNVKK